MKRLLPVLWLGAAACEPPEVRAWRGAIEVDRVREGSGCGEDEALAEVEPPEPYLVLAVDTGGLDDVVTLFWCPEARDCGVPYDGGYLASLTEERFEAHLIVAQPEFGRCTGRWAELIGEQTEQGQVTVSQRTGAVVSLEMPEEDCADHVASLQDVVCDRVVRIEGRR